MDSGTGSRPTLFVTGARPGLWRMMGLGIVLLGGMQLSACSSLPSPLEQERLVAQGELRLHHISSRPVLAAWGAPSYSALQRCQFFPLSTGNWLPNFRVKLGEFPPDWDLSTIVGDGLFLAYADRGEVLGFYEDRLVYREQLSADHIHALGKQWQREALFKTRLEGGPPR